MRRAEGDDEHTADQVFIKRSQESLRAQEKGSKSQDMLGEGAGFTWLQAGLLHGSLSSSNGYPSILKVGLSDAALALASGGAMGAQLAIRGRLGAAWAAVRFFQRHHLHVWREMK